MLGQNLKQLYESLGPRETVARLREGLEKKVFRPEDFSLRELAESFCGSRWVQRLNPRNLSRYAETDLLEAGEGVDVSAFSNITGQIIFSKIQQGWDQVARIGDALFETVPTQFDGEKIPGIGRISRDGDVVHPGQPFPELGFGEQYWETPSTTKHGFIVSVTKELVFFDRTSLVLRRAAEAGERLAYNKERRQLAVFAGVNITLGNEAFVGNNHRWNGVAYNTYDTAANAIGINSKSGVELVDWTDVEESWLLFADLRDPDTALPISVMPDTLVVMPFKDFTARRIVSATEVRSGDITTGTGTQTHTGNPVGRIVSNVYSSALLYQTVIDSGVTATNAKNWWFFGQPKKAFWYMENWPLTVVQAPSNSESDFERDIVLRYKASERGVPWSADPRYNTKLYVA